MMAQPPFVHVFGNQVGTAIIPPGFGQVQNIYFNGFALSLAPADTSLMLALDGQPQLRLSMSFTTAKTLSAYLQELIVKLESVTNHNIMKTDEVEAGLRKIKENDGEDAQRTPEQ